MSVELHDSDVFQRTHRGQHEAVFDAEGLDTDTRRLLLILNGLMPHGMVKEVLKDEGALAARLERLYRSGLIAPTTMLPPIERQASLINRLTVAAQTAKIEP